MPMVRSRVFASTSLTAAISIVLVTGCMRASTAPADTSHRAEAALALGDTSEAIDLLEQRARSREASPADYTRLGEIYRSRGGILDRLFSQRVLEDALREFPDDPDLMVALGKTYYAQRFYGDAERTFSRVLSLYPKRCEAHEYLGANAFRKWKSVQLYTDHLSAAIEHLRLAVDCAPGNEESFFKLAFSRYMLGDTALAATTCEAFCGHHPHAPRPCFLMGAIAFDQGRWEACRDWFQRAMGLLSEEERVHYTDVALLLVSDADAARYEEAAEAEKASILRLYWLEQDPDPTTEINERLLEHVYRVFLADARYGSDAPRLRGWEADRGRAFIKFGPPTHVRTTLRGRPWDGRTEIWTYVGPHRFYDLRFRDEYLNSNYIVPMNDALSARTLFEDPPESRLHRGPASLHATVDLTSFRESSTSSLVVLSFAVDEDTLQRHFRTWDIGEFVSRSAFFTEDGRPIAYDSRTIPIDSLPPLALSGGTSRRFTTSYELPFDAYRVAHSFEDAEGLAASLVWSSTNTLRYLGDSLAVSDILLHTAAPHGEGPRVDRLGGTYLPNPGGRYSPPERLRLYLEIYNLRLSEGASAFELTFSIYPAPAERGTLSKIAGRVTRALGARQGAGPVLSQSFHRIGIEDTAAEELVVDIDALEPGEYTMRASVLDNNSGERASRSKPFTKVVPQDH